MVKRSPPKAEGVGSTPGLGAKNPRASQPNNPNYKTEKKLGAVFKGCAIDERDKRSYLQIQLSECKSSYKTRNKTLPG